MRKVSIDIKKIKDKARKENKSKVSFTLSQTVFLRFKKACGSQLAMSRVVEELMLEFIEGVEK